MVSKLIIDFKPVSPKHGDLFCGKNPVEIAKHLEKKGVLGLSVVTKSQHFGGSLELLRSITKAVKLPVLRKDFIENEDDLYQTLDCGAKGILLVCSVSKNIEKLHQKAKDIGLRPVVEVHTKEEMSFAKNIGAKIILINNKDITVLEKDSGTVDLTLKLIPLAPKDAFIISASGILNHEDTERAISAGANAVLVGTAFWQGKFQI